MAGRDLPGDILPFIGWQQAVARKGLVAAHAEIKILIASLQKGEEGLLMIAKQGDTVCKDIFEVNHQVDDLTRVAAPINIITQKDQGIAPGVWVHLLQQLYQGVIAAMNITDDICFPHKITRQ